MHTQLTKYKYEDLKNGGERIKKIFDDGYTDVKEVDSHGNVVKGDLFRNKKYEYYDNGNIKKETNSSYCQEYDEEGRLLSLKSLKGGKLKELHQYKTDEDKNIERHELYYNNEETAKKFEDKHFLNGIDNKDEYLVLEVNKRLTEPEDGFELAYNSKLNDNKRKISRYNNDVIVDNEIDNKGNVIRERYYHLDHENFNEYDEHGNRIRTETFNKYGVLENARISDIEYDEKNRPTSKLDSTYIMKNEFKNSEELDADKRLYEEKTNGLNLKQLYYHLNR